MLNIASHRGCGKTTKIIQIANTLYKINHPVVVIVALKSMVELMYRMGLEKKIEVLTLRDYMETGSKYLGCTVLIDELGYVLETAFRTSHIVATSDINEITELDNSTKEETSGRDMYQWLDQIIKEDDSDMQHQLDHTI